MYQENARGNKFSYQILWSLLLPLQTLSFLPLLTLLNMYHLQNTFIYFINDFSFIYRNSSHYWRSPNQPIRSMVTLYSSMPRTFNYIHTRLGTRELSNYAAHSWNINRLAFYTELTENRPIRLLWVILNNIRNYFYSVFQKATSKYLGLACSRPECSDIWYLSHSIWNMY